MFNLVPLPPEIAQQVFVPLTAEELARIPELYEKSECKPSQDLLPARPLSGERARVLKPSLKEMMQSMVLSDPNGNNSSSMQTRTLTTAE